MKTINWLLEQMLVNNYISKKGFKNANTWLIQEAIQDDIKEKNDFAIGFAEWLYRYDNTRLPNGNWIIKLGLKPYTSEEVLEIYKKEKGL